MGWILQRRIKLFGGLGLNLSKSGLGISFRGAGGSVGNKGYSIRSGIKGLFWRKRFKDEPTDQSLVIPASIQRVAAAHASVALDPTIDENGVPRQISNITKDFKFIKITSNGKGGLTLTMLDVDTENGTALTALNELAELKRSMKVLKKLAQDIIEANNTAFSIKHAGHQDNLPYEEFISCIDNQFRAIDFVSNRIKKALKS